MQGVDYEVAETLIFAELINSSKSSLRNLDFSSITIEEINGCERFEYFNYSSFCDDVERGIKWDPAGKVTDLLPENKLRRCFLVKEMPRQINLAWMTIKFTCGEDPDFITKVLITKKKNQKLTFLSVSEQI